MQRIRQDFFKDRALFYVSRLIQRLLKKGKASNDYQLPEVYLIGILEFSMDAGEQDRYFHDIALMEKTSGKIFYNKLGFKLLEIPNFVKSESDNGREIAFTPRYANLLKLVYSDEFIDGLKLSDFNEIKLNIGK